MLARTVLEVHGVKLVHMVLHVITLESEHFVLVAPLAHSTPWDRPFAEPYVPLRREVHERAKEQLEAKLKLGRVSNGVRQRPALPNALCNDGLLGRSLLQHVEQDLA